MRWIAAALALFTALTALTATDAAGAQQAAGQSAVLAQRLFDDAVALIKAGKHAEACPKLEESERIDPGIGTRYLLADCYEHTGRPASAWSIFVEVAGLASGAAARAAEEVKADEYRLLSQNARARADGLEPALPRLTILIPDGVASLPELTVHVNGVAVGRVIWESPIPVDLGEQRVKITAKGKKPWEGAQSVMKMGDAAVLPVPARLEDDAPARESPPLDKSSSDPPSSAGHNVAAALLLGLGGAAIVGGSAAGLVAIEKNDEARGLCPAGCFQGSPELAEGTRLVAQARTAGTASTCLFIGASAAIAGAAVVFFTAPEAKPAKPRATLRWAPLVLHGGAGGLVRGTF